MHTRFSSQAAMDPDRQAIVGFDPRAIPGLQIWLDAADSNTITVTSDRVSRWMDKSSNGYTFSNGALTGKRGPARTQTLNGLDVLTFTAVSAHDPDGTYLTCTSSVPFSFSQHAVFFVHRPLGLGSFYNTFGNQNVFSMYRTPTANGCRYPQARGSTIVSYYSNYFRGEFPGRDVSTNYNLRTVNLTDDFNVITLNGTNDIPISNNPPTGYSADQTRFVYQSTCGIGADFLNSVWQRFFVGNVAEIICYSNGLSPPDQRSVEGYLAWKWGLQSLLPSTTPLPFSRNPPLSRGFLPIDIPDCIVWFDAADLRTLTLSGTQVTAWQNKGILSDVVATNTTAAPLANAPGTVSSGFTFTTSPLNTIQFPGTTYLAVSNVVTTAVARTLFYVFTVTSYGDGYSRAFASSTFSGTRQANFNAWNRDTNTINLFPSAYSATEYIGVAGAAPYSGTLPYTGIPFVIGVRHTGSYASNAGALISAISINGRPVTPTVNRRLVNGYFVGTDTFILGTGPGYTNVQRIGDVLQYDRGLTDAEMRRVEGYLCWKWGVTFADVSHAYVRFPPSTPTSFNPARLAGCQLWLDAADTSTITATGSSVTSWRDKSGLGNTLTFGASATTGTTFQNGNNVLVFSSSAGSNATCVLNTAHHTLFAVHRPDSIQSGNTGLIRFQTAPATSPYIIFPYSDAGSVNRGYVTSADGVTLSNTGAGLPDGSPSTSYSIVTAAVASASLEVFRTGSLVASSAQALTATDLSFGVSIGNARSGSVFYSGAVGEVILYNAKLSLQQRQLVEGYLAKKWAV